MIHIVTNSLVGERTEERTCEFVLDELIALHVLTFLRLARHLLCIHIRCVDWFANASAVNTKSNVSERAAGSRVFQICATRRSSSRYKLESSRIRLVDA